MKNPIKQFFFQAARVNCNDVYIFSKGKEVQYFDAFYGMPLNNASREDFKFQFLIKKKDVFYDVNGNVVELSKNDIEKNLYPASEGLKNAPKIYFNKKNTSFMECYLLGIAELYQTTEEARYRVKHNMSFNSICFDDKISQGKFNDNAIQLYRITTNFKGSTDGMIYCGSTFSPYSIPINEYTCSQYKLLELNEDNINYLRRKCCTIDEDENLTYKYKIAELSIIESNINYLLDKELDEESKYIAR